VALHRGISVPAMSGLGH